MLLRALDAGRSAVRRPVPDVLGVLLEKVEVPREVGDRQEEDAKDESRARSRERGCRRRRDDSLLIAGRASSQKLIRPNTLRRPLVTHEVDEERTGRQERLFGRIRVDQVQEREDAGDKLEQA